MRNKIWLVLKKILPGPMRRIEHRQLISILQKSGQSTTETESTGPR